MARPVDFPFSNFVFKAPEGMTDPGGQAVKDLPCLVTPGLIITRWEFTPEELEEVQRTGGCWVTTMCSVGQPGLAPFGVCANQPFTPQASPPHESHEFIEDEDGLPICAHCGLYHTDAQALEPCVSSHKEY